MDHPTRPINDAAAESSIIADDELGTHVTENIAELFATPNSESTDEHDLELPHRNTDDGNLYGEESDFAEHTNTVLYISASDPYISDDCESNGTV